MATRSTSAAPTTKSRTTKTGSVSKTQRTPKNKSTGTGSRNKFESERQILEGKVNAIDRVSATIEFDIDGTILTANDNFLSCVGYKLEEIQGQHHSLFVDSKYAESAEYKRFWETLRRGEYVSGEFNRFGKNDRPIWLNASYNPIFGGKNQVVRIIKFATDITEQKIRSADFAAQLESISKSQAIIEFDLDGRVLTANENFCKLMGYSLDELRGKHHRIFCNVEYAQSPEYKMFWQQLREGQFQIGQFNRSTKSGEEVWLQATYNPNMDLQGRPTKVVKYAYDITKQKRMELQFIEKQRQDDHASHELKVKVAQLLECVNAVAAGNFAVEVPDLGTDAIGQVSTAFRVAVGAVRKSLIDFSQVAATVATAAQQLTTASREISSGAQTQASSLEETASSLEEITSTVKQNTDNAQQARQLAVGSRDVAEKGGTVVSDAVAAMAGINQSSKKIADIITTIDEIAFQTNLLALNAAVEAARAGEQGRGFAVVAAEVRNLAQRSASAAREIKSLIEDSVTRVENGTQLVNKSGETLNEIVNSVKRVTDIVAEIAAASREQLTGVEQVNKAVTQMDRVTQANAAQTEEVSGTAASLLANAELLQAELTKFNLGADVGSQVAARVESKASTAPATSSSRTLNPVAATAEFEFATSASAAMEF